MKLNQKGYRHAKKLIQFGKVNTTSGWSMSTVDENRILGDPPNWDEYARWHLGRRIEVENEETKQAWAYPFGKNGKVYRSALVAIRQRAAQQGHNDIFEAAGKLIEMIDETKGAEKLSYEEIRQLIYGELPEGAWIVDLYDDHFVYQHDGKYYKINYSITDGKLVLEKGIVEVERKVEYVVVQSAIRISSATEDTDNYGYKWRVQVVEFGIDKNGTYWRKEPLVAALDLFEGAKVFMLSEAQHQISSHPYGKPPTELVGWLSNVKATNKGIEADLNILKSAKHLRDALVDSWERGNPDLLGLSVDIQGRATRRRINDRNVLYLEEVKSVTIDVVYEPAAGGKFIRMAAAIQNYKKEVTMLEKLLAILKSQRPDLYASIEAKIKAGTINEDEVLGLLNDAMKTDDLDEKIKVAVKAAMEDFKASGKNHHDDKEDESKQVLDQARVVACGIILRDELRASGLPELSQKRLEKQFKDRIFEVDDLRAAIKEEKEYIDQLTGSGSVECSGDIRITEAEFDRAIQMLDDFFEGKVHSFKACYIRITGDEQVTGQIRAAKRLRASIDTTTWAEIFGDAVTRKMLKDYKSPSRWDDWRKIVDIVPLSDFRTNRRIRMGGYGDLPVVAQGGSYSPLTSPGDEEATYAPSKRGGTEDLTLEAIKNDDVGAIRRIPIKLARAAKRTLYKFVFDFLATNPIIYDGTALFTAAHGNLGSAPLDATSFTERRQAVLKQTEPDSNERLEIPARYLIVPIELDKTGYDLIATPRNSDFEPTSPDYTRTLQMELIVVAYWTDPNNWYLSVDPADMPTIEIGFLDGKEEPEIFVQDVPNTGSMFSNDKLTYKIRHIYGGTVVDYRGLDGSIVV
jgi:hypothetical protein